MSISTAERALWWKVCEVRRDDWFFAVDDNKAMNFVQRMDYRITRTKELAAQGDPKAIELLNRVIAERILT